MVGVVWPGCIVPRTKGVAATTDAHLGWKYLDRLLNAVDVCQLGLHFLGFRWDKLLVPVLCHVFAGDQEQES